jgi:hypothetical protein
MTPETWIASGHELCDRDPAGRLVATPDLWRAFLARPELVPPQEACPAERALYASLCADPLRPVAPAALAALADPDAAENWAAFLGFRDRVALHPTLEAAWVALYRQGVAGLPPLLLQMLTHLVLRAALEGEPDAFAWRAAEVLFRPQRAAIHQGALLLADEETLAQRAAEYGPLGRLLEEAGVEPRPVELDVLGEANAATYPARSDAHDFALDIAEGRRGAAGLARAIERLVGHVLGTRVAVRPIPLIEDAGWTWHVGLDAEATAIANALWRGEAVEQARLARILWLGALEFADPEAARPGAAERPVLLVLAMDAARRVRAKPQNLVTGLPLREVAR